MTYPNQSVRLESPLQSRWNRWRTAMVGVLSGLIVIAASTLSVSVATAGAASPTPAATVVTAKSNPTLGTILADSSGMTLYTLMNNGQPVLCTGACAVAWPPLTVASGTPVTGPAGVTGLGTTSNANGSAVTFEGAPLYTFVNDHSSADANGNGIVAFGGTFQVVTVASPTTGFPQQAGRRHGRHP